MQISKCKHNVSVGARELKIYQVPFVVWRIQLLKYGHMMNHPLKYAIVSMLKNSQKHMELGSHSLQPKSAKMLDGTRLV